jgi:hypothetical protein
MKVAAAWTFSPWQYRSIITRRQTGALGPKAENSVYVKVQANTTDEIDLRTSGKQNHLWKETAAKRHNL